MYYTTLFDSNYLSRGIALYESLIRHERNFTLVIFPFDSRCEEVLNTLHLENVIVVPLAEFEGEELRRIKSERSHAEYCWTSTPFTIKYVFDKLNAPACTYLDSDIYFFGSACTLLKELGESSVLITPHRYTKQYDRTDTAGIYCVQFLTFKNDPIGSQVLNDWMKDCLNACRIDEANGLCGDQKYLDTWPVRYRGICELKHLGGGVAPWNVQQYRSFLQGGKILMEERSSSHVFELIFFHFQNVKFDDQFRILAEQYNSYRIDRLTEKHIYARYFSHLKRIERSLRKIGASVPRHLYKPRLTIRGMREKVGL